ncbi:hypothetical protein GCM10010300_53570 [Streptomyces olivaceoviridis]|uniref:DUF4232 domain-containing protein n=1 Tax=Streptomyces olivaceoviridis TaxID=1921 RepID=UPI0016748ADA|nr:DUF4232 domain-containing protein [Streptomyces olivaceoviridis]GGZ02872.1 hypothetical protein GCM10010300_53570 [Streptomyces olivaceoviridis]
MLFGKRTRRTRLFVAPAALSAVTLIGIAAGPSQAATRPGWADTSSLSVRVHALDSGAGQRYATVILTNKTHKTVRTQGYVGLQLLDPHGKDVPTHVVRDRGRAEPITLKPGQSAYTRLHWGAVAGAGEPTKAEKDPTRLEVTPPDSRHHLNTAWKLGEVLQKGRIDITPLAKGTGPRF